MSTAFIRVVERCFILFSEDGGKCGSLMPMSAESDRAEN
jgi:hypothetical protein